MPAACAAEAAREPLREGTRSACDAQIGASEAALAHQCGDDPSSRGVDGDGQPETDHGNRRVESADATPSICKGAPGVAGIEGGVRLDDVVDDAYVCTRPRRQ